MEVNTFDLAPGSVRITSRSRGLHRQVYERLRDIVAEGHADPSTLGRLRALVTFNLEQGEKGKASELKSNLTKRFGTDATYAGFRFVICRNMTNTEEYLAVVYEPTKIVEGRWAKREAARRAKYEAWYQRSKEAGDGR